MKEYFYTPEERSQKKYEFRSTIPKTGNVALINDDTKRQSKLKA